MTGPSALISLSLLFSTGSLVAPPDPQTVIGGEASPSCAWPSVVSLGGCTGTLIHPEVVVYAAHCGDEIPSVWFGELAFQGQGRQVDTAECHTNPGYFDGNGERHEDWAFCRLAEPVTDVPIVPPLMGCETTLLTPGRAVTLVGFGLDENDNGGIKREGQTELQWIDENGAVLAGNGEVGSCYGDSGGPIFLELPDGSWRAFGIVSGGNSCGFPAWYATIHTAIPTIEQTLGIDVTPCHYVGGGWNPSPACGDVPLEPWDGAGKTWAEGCAGGPVLPEVATCGPAYDDVGDDSGPLATVTTPAWGDVFDSDDTSGFASVDIEIDATDLPSGVERVVLQLNGMLLEDAADRDPPFRWSAVALPPGVWEITAQATDWAGNQSTAPVVMIGVDADPPAMPEPAGSTGEVEGSSSDDGGGTGGESTGSPTDATTSTGAVEPAGSSSGAEATDSTGDDGCGCTSTGAGGASAWLWLLALGLGRRRRASAALGVVLSSTGCTDDGGELEDVGSTTDATTSSSSGVELSSSTTGEPGSSTTTDASSSSSTGSASSESSTTSTCDPGTEGCSCTDDGFGCDADLRCELDTCIACPAGTQACHCIPARAEDEPGTCEGDLLCVGDLCAAPPPCPFTRNGFCDEGGACFPGSDTFDCCPVEPGVCEEMSVGGMCPDGSDPDDCVMEPPE